MVQAISQNGIDWVAGALTHVSSTLGTSHPVPLLNIGIPLASSISAGFVFWEWLECKCLESVFDTGVI